MGAKQTKEPSGSGSGWSPSHGWKRASRSGENRDILASWLKSGAPPPPYQRRISMIQEMMLMAKQGKQDEATEMLKTLRQDLGMESTSLDDVLYRYASFRNLVDPITHDLLISLARYVHCPRTEGDSLSSMEKVCRQLTYHLSPHSQWRRHGLLKRKPQACLKAVLSAPPPGGSLDLSGIPLAVRDMERLIGHLRSHAPILLSLELGFTELTDDAFLLLLPTLSTLPRLETLALNGNRLTRAVLKELTDALKDPGLFPSVTWIDLGNNVDIFSLPQPFLVSLRKRCPRAQGNLPTILEFGESQASDPPGPPPAPRGTGDEDTEEETDVEDSNMTVSMGELRSEEEVEMDGEMEIEEMMEELLDFDREVQGVGGEELEDSLDFITHNASVQIVEGEELEDSMWASMEEGGGARRRRRDSCCSSQSRRSSAGAVEPMRVEEDEVEETSRPMTTEQLT